jgi:hypothetical protein
MLLARELAPHPVTLIAKDQDPEGFGTILCWRTKSRS